MTSNDSDRIKDYFAACSRDLAPAPACHDAHVLYAPVSRDPEVVGLCASVLSDSELQRADRFAASSEKALFIQRRAFRRFCAITVRGSSRPLSQVVFEETENGRPYLSDLPDLWFSFASCQLGFLGAWSSTHGIGVDIEDPSKDLQAAELAQRFYSEAEARAVHRAGNLARLRTFYRFWSLKEAALKSVGEGLPFGLDAFQFELSPSLRVVHAPADHGGPENFDAHLIGDADRSAALVIRSLVRSHGEPGGVH
jgi:4'-phosphopantetheinyl transferase